jgi:hypothetical protein
MRIAFIPELVVGTRRVVIAVGNQALMTALMRGVKAVVLTQDDGNALGEQLQEWELKPTVGSAAEVFALAQTGEYVLTLSGRWNAWVLLG